MDFNVLGLVVGGVGILLMVVFPAVIEIESIRRRYQRLEQVKIDKISRWSRSKQDELSGLIKNMPFKGLRNILYSLWLKLFYIHIIRVMVCFTWKLSRWEAPRKCIRWTGIILVLVGIVLQIIENI